MEEIKETVVQEQTQISVVEAGTIQGMIYVIRVFDVLRDKYRFTTKK